MWQNTDLGRDCKLVKEGQKILSAASSLLETESAEAAAEFNGLLSLVSPVTDSSRRNSSAAQRSSRTAITTTAAQEMPAPPSPKNRSPKSLQALKNRMSFSGNSDKLGYVRDDGRRATIACSSPDASQQRQHVRPSPGSQFVHGNSTVNPELAAMMTPRSANDIPSDYLNLDYLPFAGTDPKASPSDQGPGFAMSDWEHVLSDMDSGHSNIFTGIYGGSECGEVPGGFSAIGSGGTYPSYGPQQNEPSSAPPISVQPPTAAAAAAAAANMQQGWSPDGWSSSTTNSDLPAAASTNSSSNNTAQSVISYSEESVDDVPVSTAAPASAVAKNGSNNNNNSTGSSGSADEALSPLDAFEGIVIPQNMDVVDGATDYWGAPCAV